MLIMISLFFIQGLNVDATDRDGLAESTGKLYIHKRMYKDPHAKPPYTQNNGLERIDESDTYGLNGVTFGIYDVTLPITEALEMHTLEDIREKIMNSDSDTVKNELKSFPKLATVQTRTFNQEKGVGYFSLDFTEVEYLALLIIEEAAPLIDGEQIENWAAPMLIVFPVENPLQEGAYLSDIHLYPKNYGYRVKEPLPEKPVPPSFNPNKPLLPQTGEVKVNMAFIGLLIVGVVGFIWLKNKKEKQ